MIHVVGILISLPHILAEGEIIESLSLGAGNTGRHHDLETDRQIAEFKFIAWRGGAEAIQQNGLFVDIFDLASATGDKRRVIYVVDREHPMRFLTHNRSMSSVLSKTLPSRSGFIAPTEINTPGSANTGTRRRSGGDRRS